MEMLMDKEVDKELDEDVAKEADKVDEILPLLESLQEREKLIGDVSPDLWTFLFSNKDGWNYQVYNNV